MSLILTAQSERRQTQRMTLRFGQWARVGRSPLVEFCLPDDTQLAEEHFTVHYHRPPRVKASSQETCLVVDGEACHELPTVTTQSIRFLAGQTTFTIRFLGDSMTPTAEQSSAAPEAHAEAHELASQSTTDLLNRYAGQMQFSPAAVALIAPRDRLTDYARRLIQANLIEDLVRLFVRHMQPNLAVSWALNFYEVRSPDSGWQESGSFVDQHRHTIACWLDKPSEENRQAVIDCRPETAEGFQRYIVQAIQYTGGSLAPTDQPAIAPPRHLTSIATLAAITSQRAGLKLDDPRVLPWMKTGLMLFKQSPVQEEGIDATSSKSR